MGLLIIVIVMFLPNGILGWFRERRGERGAGRGQGSMSALLQVEGVSKSFGGVEANRHITIGVEAGAVYGLIGPNGSGKTTLFNCIVGQHPVDGGTVTFDGTRVERMTVPGIARLGLLRTFQQTRVYGGMSCLENMQVSAAPRTAGGGRLLRRISACRHRAGRRAAGVRRPLLRCAITVAGSLSFGQQKLLEFAMALMRALRRCCCWTSRPRASIRP